MLNLVLLDIHFFVLLLEGIGLVHLLKDLFVLRFVYDGLIATHWLVDLLAAMGV